MPKMDLALLRSKFRGSMLGVLAGDCLGSPYEENEEALSAGETLMLQRSFDKLEGPMFRAPVMQFTDDSAMTRSLAESFIENKNVDLLDIAKRFVKSYYTEPNRGYGGSVVTVFQKLRNNKFKDLMSPAEQQFNGQGSYGNGSAMRITPVALFCYEKYDMLVDVAKITSKLTHTHKLGINGAILQAIAVQQGLLLNPNNELNAQMFVDELIKKMDSIEYDEEGLGLEQAHPYKDQLDIVKDFLCEEKGFPHGEKVVSDLGNCVSALYSVPTAIFCFLRAQKPIEEVQTDNPFRRAIQYAISLGGDTDTISSMTGAIAGAYYGEEKINSNMLKHCECSDQFRELGDKLLDVAMENKAS